MIDDDFSPPPVPEELLQAERRAELYREQRELLADDNPSEARIQALARLQREVEALQQGTPDEPTEGAD